MTPGRRWRVRVAALAVGALALAGCGRVDDAVRTVDTSTTGPTGSGTSGVPVVPSSTNTALPPTSTVPVSTVPASTVPAAGPRVIGVSCARHPETGGDWLVFELSAGETVVDATYGTAAAMVRGDATVLVTMRPARDASAGRYRFDTDCDTVLDVVSTPSADGTLVWSVGTRGRPRLLNIPEAGPTQYSRAVVVKLAP